MIPVDNLYPMLAFALYDMGVAGRDTLERVEFDGPVEVLGRLYADTLRRLVRRGLARRYVERTDVGPRPRGRLETHPTVSRALQLRGHVAYAYDELHADVPLNRVLLAGLRALISAPSVETDTRSRLRNSLHVFEGVRTLATHEALRVQDRLPRGNAAYAPALSLAQLALAQSMGERRGGESLLPDWASDGARMAMVFEGFVRGAASYYLAGEAKVSARQLDFAVETASELASRLIPKMKTDVFIARPGHAHILECKFYETPLARGQFGNVSKLRSGHVYQLLAYMRSAARDRGTVRGSLVYAMTGEDFSTRVGLEGFDVGVVALDLAAPWNELVGRLREELSHDEQ